MGDLIDRDGFRANVGMVLMSRRRPAVHLARRAGGRGWQFPQGGMRRGESDEESLFRELNEEIGLQPRMCRSSAARATGCATGCRQRYLRHNVQPLCLGQKQRWFLLRLRSAGSRDSLRHDGRTGIRPLALGRLLAADPRGHLLQARGLYPRAARARGARHFRTDCRRIRPGGAQPPESRGAAALDP